MDYPRVISHIAEDQVSLKKNNVSVRDVQFFLYIQVHVFPELTCNLGSDWSILIVINKRFFLF